MIYPHRHLLLLRAYTLVKTVRLDQYWTLDSDGTMHQDITILVVATEFLLGVTSSRSDQCFSREQRWRPNTNERADETKKGAIFTFDAIASLV